jgi:protein TonB
MRIVAEYIVFIGLSVGAHVLVLAQPGGVGEGAGGAQGDTQITLAAMPGDMAQLVEAWTRPPEMQVTLTALAAPLPDDPPPDVQALENMDLSRPVPVALPIPQAPHSAPRIDSAAPAPLPPVDTGSTPVLKPPATADAVPDRIPPAAPERLEKRAPSLPEIAQDSVPDQQLAAPARSVRPVMRPDRAKAAAPALRAGQKASGQGGSNQAGRASQPAPRPDGLSPAQTRNLMAQWGGRVRASIERNKRFPRGTAASGRVTLAISLSHTGRLQGVSVARSSGHAALDRAAVAAVQRTRFPAAPKGLKPGTHRFNLSISFSR